MSRVPFRLVTFRGRGFEAPAIVIAQDTDGLAVDVVAILTGDDAHGTPTAVMAPFYSVPLGNMNGTEARPSWYPIGAEAEDRIV